MRKILYLGLLALALSSISTALLAGYPACDEGDMKQTLKDLGIYGWCNAWHEAVENEDWEGQEEIELKIFAKIDPDELPWVDSVVCPCWPADEDLLAVCEPNLVLDPVNTFYLPGFGGQFTYNSGALQIAYLSNSCSYNNGLDPNNIKQSSGPTTTEQGASCLIDLGAIADPSSFCQPPP